MTANPRGPLPCPPPGALISLYGTLHVGILNLAPDNMNQSMTGIVPSCKHALYPTRVAGTHTHTHTHTHIYIYIYIYILNPLRPKGTVAYKPTSSTFKNSTFNGKEFSVEYTDSQTQLHYLYYCYNEGSNNDMFRPYKWAIFRL